MKKKLITGAAIILLDRVVPGSVLFSDEIERVFYDEPEPERDDFAGKDMEVIDGRDCYLSAGFIDIHIHGAGGYDTMDSSYQALNGISQAIIK
ncbi:MAG: N-acetylglucosamine-6-phosphate deacetylase, partial [Halanaerobiales bacterium]